MKARGPIHEDPADKAGNSISGGGLIGYLSHMAFPQYRIPIHRLKEEWSFRLRMERLRRKRPTRPPSEITDNSAPCLPKTIIA